MLGRFVAVANSMLMFFFLRINCGHEGKAGEAYSHLLVSNACSFQNPARKRIRLKMISGPAQAGARKPGRSGAVSSNCTAAEAADIEAASLSH